MSFEDIDILRANTMLRIYNYDGAEVHDILFRNLWFEEYSLRVQDLGYDGIFQKQSSQRRDDLPPAYLCEETSGEFQAGRGCTTSAWRTSIRNLWRRRD